MTRERRPPPSGKPFQAAPPLPAATGREAPAGHGLARVLSKLGHCSRAQGEALVRAGRVTLDGRVVLDPEHRTDPARAAIAVDGAPLRAHAPVHLMLNKPRGLVTTRDDPEGRPTVFSCLEGLDLPHVAPVGRLDKASEGLLLFTNDTAFADRLTDPARHLDKTYHVQIDRHPDDALLARFEAGIVDRGERLALKRAGVLRAGERTAWLEVVLDEGRNRQIRRVLAAFEIETLRLVRVAVGPLALGDLAKGAVRALTPAEVAALGG